MGFKVLIVEDSLTVRIMLKRLLAVVNVDISEVDEAENGEDGLRKMRAKRPDLVMADLNMETMTGLEMIKHMRQDPLLAGVSVVVISSEGNPAVIQDLARNGVREFIRKPFDLGMLQTMLATVLENDGVPS
jgi:two-component system chemotaxis response regulator CheY